MTTLRRSRRIAGLPVETINPPDAPETELVMELVIRIPVRRFPPANQEEKEISIRKISEYLKTIEYSHVKSTKVYYSSLIFYEIARQPLLVAHSLKFRNVVLEKMAEMELELKNGNETPHDADLENALHEAHMMFADLHHHPWYIPE